MKPPRLLDQDSSGGVQGPGVGERHKAASKPLIQSGPQSAAGRSRATSKSLPMRCPYFDITNEREKPRQKGLTIWGYLPDQWQLANVAYPLFLRQGRVNDGVGACALLPALLPESVCTENESTAGR